MKRLLSTVTMVCLPMLVLQLSSCNAPARQAPPTTSTPSPESTPLGTPTPVVIMRELPITLPMLDALFFVDRRFSEKLKTDLQMSDDQIAQIREAVRIETTKLRDDESADGGGRTSAAGARAIEKLSAIVGAEKAVQLVRLAIERWQATSEGTVEEASAVPLASPELTATLTPRGASSPIPVSSPELAGTLTPRGASPPSSSPSATPLRRAVAGTLIASLPYSAPADTRIIVNAPSYRMDVFSEGRLIKSYRVAIGYPEFPLPTGMRKATSIIFNPTWIPPDEPWVEASKKVKVGQKVAAGDKLNPLGPIKIPIGLPSLIHGGKDPARIGSFASHGCVGMTNTQIQSFSQVLARLGGLELSEQEIKDYEKTPTVTKSLKLTNAVPVELRYETISVEDGKLNIYRDVYDRGTNVIENLETVLGTYGIALADLTEQERARAMAALDVMSSGPVRQTASVTMTEAEKAAERQRTIARGQLSRQLKGKKMISIEIAAVAGKGYPSPAELDTGTLPKPPVKKSAKKR